MKINNLLKSIFTLSLTLMIGLSYSLNLGKNAPGKPKSNGTSLETSKVDSIREILVLGLKKGVSHSLGSESETCIQQMTSTKYTAELIDFWGLLKRIFDANSPRPYMLNKEYIMFISKVGKTEELENGVNCEDFFGKNLASDDELQNRGKTARTHIDPLINSKFHVEVTGKNFITAFTGVHRFTKESDTLIPKLNAKHHK